MERARGQGIGHVCLLIYLLVAGVSQASETGQYAPVARSHVLQSIDETIAVLSDAAAHGINSRVADIAALESVRSDIVMGRWSAAWHADLQTFIVEVLLEYAVDFTLGRENPSRHDVAQIRAALEAAIAVGQITEWYTSRMPTDPAYHRLRAAMRQLLDATAAKPWPTIGSGPTLLAGDRGERVARLRARLGLELDSDAVFDEQLTKAVIAYQNRHGLDADGVVGRGTLEHLDVSLEQRVRQIQTNLERWRRGDFKIGAKQVRVNLPSYELEYRDGDGLSGRMRVVIGSTDNPTPLLTDTIEYLVFSPYWFVPERIALKEIVPKLHRDSSYLERLNLDVFAKGSHQPQAAVDLKATGRGNFPYYLRQRPGPKNSLGRAKFIFPNEKNIYLHDTSSPQLFRESRRAYSHGCIRVEDARLLAEWLLINRADWDGAAIDQAMDADKPKRVALSDSVPIITTYFTAVAHDSGEISFYDDVYAYDPKHDGAMASTYLPARAVQGLAGPQFALNRGALNSTQ
ncbi:MAG: L,D-transpeptidase family protein [Gammaproteobacteria bacterium]|nr:L,D-transpeptidase family protein [Gammaproteobacteria bacterium]